MDLFNLVPLVIAFPVLGLLINLIFGRRLSEKAVGTIASLAVGLSFVVAVVEAAALTGHPEGGTITLLDWIHVGSLDIPWSFRVDTLSVTMMLVVSGVGTLIHIYSIGYMRYDVRLQGKPGRYPRFFVFLNLFIALMMVLVTANNYLVLFVGWEGVGLCSFLLIGFWFDKGKDGIGNAQAAKKAMIVNRVGDFGFLIAAFLIFTTFGTFQFNQIFAEAPAVAQTSPGLILAITLFLLLGVTGKSAQLPLFVWLPDAMAGPTPVSALIHAATMVTAGVYLITRSYPLYVLVPTAQNTVALVGGITALFAATIAVAQFDIKKVLAYSTISQLGFMIAAVGMGAFTAGMFHLVTHAFFKALLFLGAGSVIQGMEKGEHIVQHDPHLNKAVKGHEHDFDAQDMRNMGGLRKRMPFTFWVYIIAGLALAGIPPLAGFWSKDEILAQSLSLNITVYVLLTIAALLTALYIGRQLVLVFFGKSRTEVAVHAQESPAVMTIPLGILGLLAFFGGLINVPGLEAFSLWLEHTIQPIREGTATLGAAPPPGFNPVVATIATLFGLFGLLVAWLLYARRYPKLEEIPKAHRPDDPLRLYLGPLFYAMEHRWWVDDLYHLIFVRGYQGFAHWLVVGEEEVGEPEMVQDWVHDLFHSGSYKLITNFIAMVIDLGFFDALFNVVADGVRLTSARLRRIQTGYVSNYALVVFLGVVVIVGYLILRVNFYGF